MPTVADCETPITSNLKCAASNSEDNNEVWFSIFYVFMHKFMQFIRVGCIDVSIHLFQTLTNVSNSICDSETPQFYNVGQTNKLPKEPNKHDSNPFDNVSLILGLKCSFHISVKW